MDKIRLGRTGLMVSRSAFGGLPIQRDDRATAVAIVRRAYEGGINFFDTARGYTDSESKIGEALSDVRGEVILATKAPHPGRDAVLRDLEESLRQLRTDHVDLLQLHNPKELPDPDDPQGSYAGLLEAQRQGMARFIGVTNHSRQLALRAAESGLYDTVQFPFSYLAGEEDAALARRCGELDVGFIAMKALSGGLITDAATAVAYMRQFDNVAPIWGVQHLWELEQFLALEADPPALDEAMAARIQADRVELAGAFCRGCGYCLPCPADIPIPTAARIYQLITRSPYKGYISRDYQAQMDRIASCVSCRACASRCPYGLDTPRLLREQLAQYRAFVARHADEVE